MSEVTYTDTLPAQTQALTPPGLWMRQRRRAAARAEAWKAYSAVNPCPWIDTHSGTTINRQQRRHYERAKRLVLRDIDDDIKIARLFEQHDITAQLQAQRERIQKRVQPRWADKEGRPYVAEIPEDQMGISGTRLKRKVRRFLAGMSGRVDSVLNSRGE